MNEPAAPDPLEVLQRWEDSGGTWRLVHDDPGVVVVELLTCSGGEVMGHVRTDVHASRLTCVSTPD